MHNIDQSNMKNKYDVFISSKREDYHIAEKVYDYLVKNGLSVFLASRELQKIGEAQYALAIDEVLDSTTHMIVVASSLTNIKSKYVQYEWSIFSNDLKSGYRQGNLLTILDDSVELRTLPPSLRHQQSFRFNNFKEHILDYILVHGAKDNFEIEYSFEEFDALLKNGNVGNNDQTFILPIEDVLNITGRGIVVTGKIERGKIKVGDNLDVVGYGEKISTVCLGIEMHSKLWDEAQTGDEVGLLLKGLKNTDTLRGQVVSTPDSIIDGNTFSCDCYFIQDDIENKHNYTLTSSSSLEFYIRTAAVQGRLEFPNGIDYARPNDYLPLRVVLTEYVPLNRGLIFAIRMNNSTIGVGIVKRICD